MAEELNVQRPEGRESRPYVGSCGLLGAPVQVGVACRVRGQVRVWGRILAGQSSEES